MYVATGGSMMVAIHKTTLYVNKYVQKDLTSGNTTSFYYLGGTLVAMKEGTATVNYHHQDSLGGTTVMSNSSGGLIASVSYTPFGEVRNAQGTACTDKLFTGQRLDDTGLYDYGARYYDSTIGRFASADTFAQNVRNPQAANRYSYVYNNPLNQVDPSGHIVQIHGQDVLGLLLGRESGRSFSFDTEFLLSAYMSARSVDSEGLFTALESASKVVNIIFGSAYGAAGITLPTSRWSAAFQMLFGNSNKVDYTITIDSSYRNSQFLPSLIAHELYHSNDPWVSDSIQEELGAYNYEYNISTRLGLGNPMDQLYSQLIPLFGSGPTYTYSTAQLFTAATSVFAESGSPLYAHLANNYLTPVTSGPADLTAAILQAYYGLGLPTFYPLIV